MQLEKLEQEVLGWMLMMGDRLALQDDHFTQERHAAVFRAIEWCREHDSKLDEEAVALALEERGELGLVGGRAYLDTLILHSPRFAASAFRAAELLKSEHKTRLIRAHH